MHKPQIFITSKKASELLDVHESSVKRWCNSGELQAVITDGGHRRIDLEQTLKFAEIKNIEHPLKAFRNYAGEMFLFKETYTKKKSLDLGLKLLLDWMQQHQYQYIKPFLNYCDADIKIPFSLVCDQLIFPVLECVGEWWMKQEIGVADEHRISQAWIEALAVLRHLNQSSVAANEPDDLKYRAIVACSEENNHDIAAQCLRMLLERANVEVIYLGPCVPVQEIIRMQEHHQAELVCLSFSPLDDCDTIETHLKQLSSKKQSSSKYSLAVGGQPCKGFNSKFSKKFNQFEHFNNITQFEVWIDNMFIDC